MSYPEDLQYTAEHEWVRQDGELVAVGITSYAAAQLGDVVFVELPAIGRSVAAGESIGEIESTKSVGELYAPVAGVVAEINQAVVDAPELVNGDAFGEGWLVKLRVESPAEVLALPQLISAEQYAALVGE